MIIQKHCSTGHLDLGSYLPPIIFIPIIYLLSNLSYIDHILSKYLICPLFFGVHTQVQVNNKEDTWYLDHHGSHLLYETVDTKTSQKSRPREDRTPTSWGTLQVPHIHTEPLHLFWNLTAGTVRKQLKVTMWKILVEMNLKIPRKNIGKELVPKIIKWKGGK